MVDGAEEDRIGACCTLGETRDAATAPVSRLRHHSPLCVGQFAPSRVNYQRRAGDPRGTPLGKGPYLG